MSPAAAAGSRFNLAPHPTTAITYKFLAPVLSAQFITAPTGNAKDMRNLLPEAPPLPARRRQPPPLLFLVEAHASHAISHLASTSSPTMRTFVRNGGAGHLWIPVPPFRSGSLPAPPPAGPRKGGIRTLDGIRRSEGKKTGKGRKERGGMDVNPTRKGVVTWSWFLRVRGL